MELKIRRAKAKDRKSILSFCNNTFSWGDYIDRVWDTWYNEKSGRLYVVESLETNNKKNRISMVRATEKRTVIAMSHVSVCPFKGQIWIEGIRVHPAFRNRNIASELIKKMLVFGCRLRIDNALAIVASENKASQALFKKSRFKDLSIWGYYNTKIDTINNINNNYKPNKGRFDVKIAASQDLGSITNYLARSKIYKKSGKRYMKSWRWYQLNQKTITMCIREKRLIIITSLSGTGSADKSQKKSQIRGIAILNTHGYWDVKDSLQIVYIDYKSQAALKHLVASIIFLYITNRRGYGQHQYRQRLPHYNKLQISGYQTPQLSNVMNYYNIKQSDQFILYHKRIRNVY